MVEIMDAVVIIPDVVSSLVMLVIVMTSCADAVNPRYFVYQGVEKTHLASERFLREQKKKYEV